MTTNTLIPVNTLRIFDFHGGIHPPENKTQSSRQPIRSIPLPSQLVLPLAMHIGAPAKPIVEVGEQVLKGQKIADASGVVSVPLHAPTSGRVVAIGPRPVQHPSGMDAPCIVIEPDGRDTWCERHPLANWQDCSPSTLIARLREAGIAGLGGAGFPTAVKVNLKEGTRIEQLLLNGVECEPYITADDRLMRERAAQIVGGIRILQHLVKPAQTLVGIEDNKPEAIAAMQAACDGTDIRIVVVPTKYPSGGEKQLIQLLTGKEVPSGGIPAQIGVVCQNVGTALAIHRAIELGEPLISRITTLTGNALKEPGNIEVLIGTPVSHLLACAGVDSARVARLVMGGPMMGFALHSPLVPVVKTSNCIIAATATEMPEPAPEQPCIRCGSCAEVCPADLLPQQLYWYSKNSDLERAQQYHLLDCIECGACAYVCPSNIPLVQYYRFAKGEIRDQIAEQQKADKARLRFEARQARLEKEAAEKEARRKARLAGNKPAPAAPGVDVAALKTASLEASSAYKAAVKALKEAEANGAADLDTLRANVDALKAKADAAKSAVREAGSSSAGPAAAAPQDDLKKAMLEASSAYKAAVKAAKEAEQNGDANAAELRARADALKAKADALKAQLRDAGSAASPAPAAAKVGEPATAPAAEQDRAAERAQKMKTLKTRYNSLHKLWKEANAALERAERDGADNLDEQRTRVADLLKQAEEAKAQLNELVDAAKAGIRASGSDLKTLKLEAARAESALRSKEQELADAKKSADEERINVLYQERDMLRREVDTATHALQSALKEQGLSE